MPSRVDPVLEMRRVMRRMARREVEGPMYRALKASAHSDPVKPVRY